MKILFVCDYFPPFTPGGAEWSTYYLAQALSRKGYHLTILTPNYSKLPLKEKKQGFKIIRFPFPFKLIPGQKTLPFWLNHNIFYYFYSGFWIIKVALEEKADLIHLQSLFSLPGAILAKLVSGKPLVFTIRDTTLFCPTGLCLQKNKILKRHSQFKHFWNQCSKEYINNYFSTQTKLSFFYHRLGLFYFWLDNWLKRKLLGQADQLIFISRALEKLYLKAELIRPDKSQVVYNLPPSEIKSASQKIISQMKKKLRLENKKIVFYAGRLTLGKGVYNLMKAAELIYKKNKETVFVLIGKGKLKVNLPLNVKIISPLAHEKLLTFYQMADIVVVPTLGFEPFGRIPQEAALFRKPVIISKSGGLVEQVVDKKTGLIVAKNNVGKLALAILKLVENKDLRKKMGRKHFKYIRQKFNQKKIVNQLLLIYQSLK